MAFFKKRGKKKKLAKGFVTGMVIMLVISCTVVGFLYMRHAKIASNYEAKITELERVFSEETRQVARVVGDIYAGDSFDIDKVEMVAVPGAVCPENAVTSLSELDGRVAKLDMKTNTPILKSMLTEENIAKNAREVELNMLLLPSNLTGKHYMDIRINFPTGEDYVVISKKKVRELFLKENTVWVWLSEREILELSSAIIDAYLREGSKLYCVTYIDPMFQEESTPNYPENLYVLDLIKKDPNIINRATDAMAADIRMMLENNLNGLAKDDADKIKGNILNEKSKRGTQVQDIIKQESIMTDQTEAVDTTDTTGMFDDN